MSLILPIYQVDAFADAVFRGNPAAVCPLAAWLPDELLQAIAAENNLSETAFFVAQGEAYQLRWFAPKVEVMFCGHATLASAYVLFNHLSYSGEVIHFHTRRGAFFVRRDKQNYLAMDLPAEPHAPATMPEGLADALGAMPQEVFRGANLMAVFANETEIACLAPSMEKLAAVLMREEGEAGIPGLICTAPAKDDDDFISRFFAPAHGIDEDPATGSAHCMLAPYWGARLEKTHLKARQISRRGAELLCELSPRGRIILKGRCVDYLQGQISLP